jgi:hypothetical protein
MRHVRVRAIVRDGVAAMLLPALLLLATPARAQVVADRQVSSVYGQVVTQSDVWQAIEMGWVPEGMTEFAAAQREVENRLLILREASRLSAAAPSAEAIAAVRGRWQTRFGDGQAAARMERSGVTDAMLDAWCRDTATIDAYLQRRFGAVREADRSRAIADWIGLLRDRAGLPR